MTPPSTCLELPAITAKTVPVHMEDENTVWRGGPSQVVNLPTFAACLLMGGAFLVVGANTHWAVSLGAGICAVIGGIYTVIGLVDNVIYHGGQSIKKAL